MPGKIIILKFGGSSLEDACAFERVARIIGSCESASRVVVVSAMNGMTDALLLSARAAANGELDKALVVLQTHVRRHLAVAQALLPGAQEPTVSDIKGSQQEIEEILHQLNEFRALTPRLQDRIISYGEQLAAKLLTLMLATHGEQAVYVDARRCILTNEEHGAAQPLLEESRQLTRAALLPLIATQSLPVIGGFFALSTSGATTTLGRGSSDYTATLIASALDAHETQIWTDVNGVLSADPHLIENARPIPWLSYLEAAELARFGGKVLHPKTIQPVELTGIPLRVCNSRRPESRGTVVSANPPGANCNGIKAISHKAGITVICFAASPAFMSNGFRRTVELIFQEHHTTVDIVSDGESRASLICEPTANLPAVVERLEQFGSIRVKNDLAVICMVGVSAAELLESDPSIHWRQVSSVSAIAFVPNDRVASIISTLHQRIVNH